MPRSSLLFLVLVVIVSSTLAAGQTKSSEPAPMVATAESLPSPSQGGTSQSFQLTPAEPRADGTLAPPDDTCYKILAFIFKTDDDRAPEFVRSTTCGPRQPHTKSITATPAKLVPAN